VHPSNLDFVDIDAIIAKEIHCYLYSLYHPLWQITTTFQLLNNFFYMTKFNYGTKSENNKEIFLCIVYIPSLNTMRSQAKVSHANLLLNATLYFAIEMDID